MCELEHDAAKGQSGIRRDCSFERPLPRRKPQRSIKSAATARKCCISNSCMCIGPLSPHSVSSVGVRRTAASLSGRPTGDGDLRRKSGCNSWRMFDFSSITPGATGVEAFSLESFKVVYIQCPTNKSPNRRSHEVWRISAREKAFGRVGAEIGE